MTDMKPDPRLYELFAEDREEAPYRKPKPRWYKPTGRPVGRPRRPDLEFIGPENGGCAQCGVKMRRRPATLEDNPGTIVYGGHGLCSSCHEVRRLKEKR